MPGVDEKTCEARHSSHAGRIHGVEEAIERLTGRLPTWATVLLSILTMAIGWLVKTAFA